MENKKDILEQVLKEAQMVEVPKKLRPENIQKLLETKPAVHSKRLPVKLSKWMITAACLILLIGGIGGLGRFKGRESKSAATAGEKGVVVPGETVEIETAAEESLLLAESNEFGTASYEEIYESMLPVWERESGNPEMEEAAAVDDINGVIYEAAEAEKRSAEDSLISDQAYGSTNIQTVGVDEGDIIKNDGRYLYQIVDTSSDTERRQAIQIVDTLDGLTLISRLGGFQNIQEFYVRDDRLVVVEDKYHELMISNTEVAYDQVAYTNYDYHEISFYDLADRTRPYLLKKFTLEGSYASSRVVDGYFYGFSRYYASPGEGEADYDAYIPRVDGKRISAEDILLPKESEGISYLVVVSVAMEDPSDFIQTRAVVSSGNLYYVSQNNIYTTAYNSMEEKEGWSETSTRILRFSYEQGEIHLEATGRIKGQLESSFSLDEYEGNLRAVSTVREYNFKELVDDRTGKRIGYELLEEKETNSLYVLNDKLEVIGSIEGLAEDERIYSARFLGETGYFVTFRQTDPLYAVDLSDPVNPKILSELKVSGFSEYLHLYGNNRLLGIGMEADEETGIQNGMKLSMFDITDPASVSEVSKLHLSEYDYSEALSNHKAVLISPEFNIFGFEAEGYNNGYKRKYLVFSYDSEQDIFIKEMELEAKDVNGDFCKSRGTFIGNIFYLLSEDGSVTSYNRQTGEKIDRLLLPD